MEQVVSGLGDIVWFIITAYILGAVAIVGAYVVRARINPKKEHKNKYEETFDDAPRALVFKALAVGLVMRFLVLMFTGL